MSALREFVVKQELATNGLARQVCPSCERLQPVKDSYEEGVGCQARFDQRQHHAMSPALPKRSLQSEAVSQPLHVSQNPITPIAPGS